MISPSRSPQHGLAHIPQGQTQWTALQEGTSVSAPSLEHQNPHAGGFVHDSIRINFDGTTAPSLLSNAERKQRFTEPGESIWRSFLRVRNFP